MFEHLSYSLSVYCSRMSLFVWLTNPADHMQLTAHWGGLCEWQLFCMPAFVADHFTLAVFYVNRKEVVVYDPMPSAHNFDAIKRAVLRYGGNTVALVLNFLIAL